MGLKNLMQGKHDLMHYDMQAYTDRSPETNTKRALLAYNGCVYVFLTGLLTCVDHCFVSQTDLTLILRTRSFENHISQDQCSDKATSRSNPMLANSF